MTARDIELPDEVTLKYWLTCRDPKAGKLEWQREFYTGRPPGGRHRKNSFVSETRVLAGSLLVIVDDNEKQPFIAAYDTKTGNVTHRTQIDPAATAFTSSPWAYIGKVFFLSEKGQTFVVEAGESFKLLHVNALDDMALASPPPKP